MILVGLGAGCGWLPPDSPPQKPAPVDPDIDALMHTWKIRGHRIAPRANVNDADASRFHGRTIAITESGYVTPWHGTCDSAGRQRHERTIADVSVDLDISRSTISDLGITDPVQEYRLTCNDGRTPPFAIYVSGTRAATCWSGACYLLER